MDLTNDILYAIKELGIDRMPTSSELRLAGMSALDSKIQRYGGLIFWSNKLGLQQKVKTIRWNDELIEQGIKNVMNSVCIDRMPSRTEIYDVRKDDALHNAISKNGGYRFWANKLGLVSKESETQLGQSMEDLSVHILSENGFKVQRMTTKYPFDLLVNDNVSIDVKTGRAYDLKGSRIHTFGISKKYASCDIYLILALSEDGRLEKTFCIPSHHLKLVTLSIGSNSKYNKYIDRFDYIDKYSEFYYSI